MHAANGKSSRHGKETNRPWILGIEKGPWVLGIHCIDKRPRLDTETCKDAPHRAARVAIFSHHDPGRQVRQGTLRHAQDRTVCELSW